MEGLLIIGNLNARIGEWQIGEKGEREKSRKSYVKIVNRVGEKLLDFCEEIGATIRNGDIKGTWEGCQTCISDGGNSVLDLVIEIERGKESVIEEMKIVPKVESDHLPVSITCKGLRVMFVQKREWAKRRRETD